MDSFTIPEQPAAGPEAVTIVQDAASVDPAAPYGRFANGKPRKSPSKGAKKAAGARPSAPRPSSARAPKKPAAPDFRPVIEEGANVLSLLLIGLGRRNRAFLADAAAIQMNAADGAHVLNEVAKINPAIERALSFSAPAVPYVLLGNFLFNLGAQIAANHGTHVPGVAVHDPEELAAGMERQMRVASEQAEAQKAAAERDQAEAREHSYAGV